LLVRKITRKDMPSIVKLEKVMSYDPLTELTFHTYVHSAVTIALLAEENNWIGAYIIASIKTDRILIHKFVCVNNFVVSNVETTFINLMKDRCTGTRTKIEYRVPERNLRQQLVLRDNGFRAIRVEKGYYRDEDAYLMEWNSK